MGKDRIKTSEFIVQTLASFIISFLACQTGFVCAWPSYTVANFKSNTTVLATPMSSLHISLLGSLPNVGALVASPFCVPAFDTMGRKYATMLFGLPFVITWTIISLTSNVTLVLLAICFSGIGIAGQNVSMIYISEISHDSIRGGLTACSASGYFLGILISYILGGYLSYMQVIYAHLTMSVLSIALLALIPDSPVFLVLVGREKEAAKAISFYKRVDVKSKEVEAEIAKIKFQMDPRLEKILQQDNDLAMTDELVKKLEPVTSKENVSAWKFLWRSQSSKKALIATIIIMALTIMMGNIVLQVYAEPLFKDAVPSMPPNQCAIFLAVDFLVASVVCVLAIDKFGRKSLLIQTSVGSGICTLLLGTQLLFHWAPQWFTALLIYGYSFIYTVGCAVIPFVLAAEIFLPEVRSLCNSIVLAFVWVSNFITLVIFNPLVDSFGMGPVFFLFSVICFLGAVYCQFWIPETKGMSVDAIQLAFLKKRNTKN